MIQIAMIVSGAVLILAVVLVCAAGFFSGPVHNNEYEGEIPL